MGGPTRIEWTDATWNPVTGCTTTSPGCDHCYALRFAERFRGVPGHHYEQGFDLKLHPDRLEQPARWKRPRLVFVNSMSDLFHARIPEDYIRRVFDVMESVPRHRFQVLTKRSGRMRRFMHKHYGEDRAAPPNVWLGVSVEDRARQVRIRHLQETPARTRFLSIEPLLERLNPLHLDKIHWVIVGGESGPRARKMEEDWVRAIRDECERCQTPFFFKQWGGRWPKSNGRKLDDRTYDDMPKGETA